MKTIVHASRTLTRNGFIFTEFYTFHKYTHKLMLTCIIYHLKLWISVVTKLRNYTFCVKFQLKLISTFVIVVDTECCGVCFKKKRPLAGPWS